MVKPSQNGQSGPTIDPQRVMSQHRVERMVRDMTPPRDTKASSGQDLETLEQLARSPSSSSSSRHARRPSEHNAASLRGQPVAIAILAGTALITTPLAFMTVKRWWHWWTEDPRQSRTREAGELGHAGQLPLQDASRHRDRPDERVQRQRLDGQGARAGGRRLDRGPLGGLLAGHQSLGRQVQPAYWQRVRTARVDAARHLDDGRLTRKSNVPRFATFSTSVRARRGSLPA